MYRYVKSSEITIVLNIPNDSNFRETTQVFVIRWYGSYNQSVKPLSGGYMYL